MFAVRWHDLERRWPTWSPGLSYDDLRRTLRASLSATRVAGPMLDHTVDFLLAAGGLETGTWSGEQGS